MSPGLPVREDLPWEDLPVREDCGYIKTGATMESPFRDRPVTESHHLGSAVCRVLGLWMPHLLFRLKPWTLIGDFHLSCGPCWWYTMQSGTALPVVDQAGAPSAAGNPLPGTFLGSDLNLLSDRLYDLDSAMPDVIGLRAIQPDATVIKVMSIPDNRCIRVVIPDDHVPIEFHEVLIHDLEVEEPPFVALCDLGCLRLDWPKALFTFMGRYQLDLERLRRECRERFGHTQSGLCTFCGKYIQQNLGRHVACYHMDLAQLWWCPVTWCTVWRGTPQDSIDHTRNIPAIVKASNLARWFPLWTVSHEQWTLIMRSSVSGIDDLLFSRIGVPAV